MKPKIQRWKPDTCDCELIEYWDENGVMSYVTDEEAQSLFQQIYDANPESTLKPSDFPQKPVERCVHHSVHSKGAVLGAVVKDENQRKNVTHKLFIQELQKIDLSDGLKLNDGLEYKWSFDKDRKLVASIDGVVLDKTVTDSIKEIADTTFGEGKVISG